MFNAVLVIRNVWTLQYDFCGNTDCCSL